MRVIFRRHFCNCMYFLATRATPKSRCLKKYALFFCVLQHCTGICKGYDFCSHIAAVILYMLYICSMLPVFKQTTEATKTLRRHLLWDILVLFSVVWSSQPEQIPLKQSFLVLEISCALNLTWSLLSLASPRFLSHLNALR